MKSISSALFYIPTASILSSIQLKINSVNVKCRVNYDTFRLPSSLLSKQKLKTPYCIYRYCYLVYIFLSRNQHPIKLQSGVLEFFRHLHTLNPRKQSLMIMDSVAKSE